MQSAASLFACLAATGIEGIKHLRIDSEMQKKAEEQGIDWYEIWPDLEDVVIID